MKSNPSKDNLTKKEPSTNSTNKILFNELQQTQSHNAKLFPKLINLHSSEKSEKIQFVNAEDIKIKQFQENFEKKKKSMKQINCKLRNTLNNFRDKLDFRESFYEKQKRVNQIFLRRLLPLTQDEKDEVEYILKSEPSKINMLDLSEIKSVIIKQNYMHPSFVRFQQKLKDKLKYTVRLSLL